MASNPFPRRPAPMVLRAAVLALALCAALPASGLDKAAFKVFIVSDDDSKEKFVDLRAGFTARLDSQLAAAGAKASYTVFDTKGDPDRVPAIIRAIEDGSPDLIAVINNAAIFADTNITNRLTDPKYRFVSENSIPVQSGTAKTWDKPGGNVTGVGVFIQFTPILRLAKLINPGFKEVYFWTWGTPQTAPLNDYFRSELKAACAATGIEIADFREVASAEEQFAHMLKLDAKGPAAFAMAGVSAWVHEDGSPADMTVEEASFWNTAMKHLPLFAYDEAAVRLGAPAGVCVIWRELGEQLADKAVKVLAGAKPGDLAWSYPRSYQVMVNLAGAERIGLEIPKVVTNGAWRVYTDFAGSYISPRK